MDITRYTLKDLLITSLKSEIEAKKVYQILANGVKNFFLKDRLVFLANEEDKHAQYFDKLLKERFPGEVITLPAKSPVPMPELMIPTENVLISEVLESAMKAEMAAHEFYKKLADQFTKEEEYSIKSMILFIANMELGHYKLLEIETENARIFEDYETGWPMIHVGP